MKQGPVNLSNNSFKSVAFLPTSARTASIRLTVLAGSKYDPVGKGGLSHLIEHLLASGSKNFVNPKELAEIVLSRGGSYEIFTDREYLTFETKTTNLNIEDGFKYLSEVVFNPFFLEESLIREKKVIAEEIISDQIQPESQFWNKVLTAAWPKSWKSAKIMGSASSIERITLGDVEDFYQNNYKHMNMILTIVGNQSPEEISSLLIKYLNIK